MVAHSSPSAFGLDLDIGQAGPQGHQNDGLYVVRSPIHSTFTSLGVNPYWRKSAFGSTSDRQSAWPPSSLHQHGLGELRVPGKPKGAVGRHPFPFFARVATVIDAVRAARAG